MVVHLVSCEAGRMAVEMADLWGGAQVGAKAVLMVVRLVSCEAGRMAVEMADLWGGAQVGATAV